jgi:hypothetical protein
VQFRRYFFRGIGLILSASIVFGFGAYHRTPLSEPGSTNLPPELVASNSLLQRISEDVFTLGLVRLDKRKKTISFPAKVNMAEGTVEYALVHSTGKVHESVLKTDADPLQIHLASLLLGTTSAPIQRFRADLPQELQGPRINIWAGWLGKSGEIRVPLENLVSNTVTQARMTPGAWAYNGSRVVDGTFLAHRDGSIVSVITDPDSLVNNPRPGRENDEIWRSNAGLVPPVGTPVEVTIEMPKDS